MALNTAPKPFELADDAIARRGQIETFVRQHRQEINDAYLALTGNKAPHAKINKMAEGTSAAYSEMVRVFDAVQWKIAFESYHGQDSFNPKFKKGKDGSKNKLNASLKDIENIKANFDSLDHYEKVLAARTAVDGEDDDLVKRFGRQSLINAHLGIGRSQDNLRKFQFLKGLNPVFKTQFGREASIQDVDQLQERFTTVANYQNFLGFGSSAQKTIGDIGAEDLGGFGAGGITQAQLQEELYKGGNLNQRKIDEARIKRKNAFTPGQSQAYGSTSEGGSFKQNLF